MMYSSDEFTSYSRMVHVSRERNDGYKRLNDCKLIDDEKTSVLLRAEFADGYERLHFEIEKQVKREMDYGYRLMMAETVKERSELNQRRLFKLDVYAILSILQFSATCAVDLLAFSLTCRVARSMLMGDGQDNGSSEFSRFSFVRTQMEKLCFKFQLPYHVLVKILEEYEGTLSGGGSVLCLTNHFRLSEDTSWDVRDLDIYLPYEQGMRLLASIHKLPDESFPSIAFLRPHRYAYAGGTVVNPRSDYKYNPIMALSIDLVLTFSLLGPESSTPSLFSKKIEFIILKHDIHVENQMSKCLNYFDFTICANAITVVKPSTASCSKHLSVRIASANDHIHKRLICPSNFLLAHRTLFEYCDTPQSQITFDSTKHIQKSLQKRRKKYESRGYTFPLNDRGLIATSQKWTESGQQGWYSRQLFQGQNALHHLASDFDADEKLQTFEIYLNKHPSHATQADYANRHTPAHIAAINGNIAVLNLFIDHFPELVAARAKDAKFVDDCLPSHLDFMHRRRFFEKPFEITLRLLDNYEAVRKKVMAMRKQHCF